MTDTSEQIKKIQKFVSTSTNPKLKKTYQDLLVKLQEKLKSETPKQQELQVQAVKPERKTSAQTEKKTTKKTTKKTELKSQATVESLASEPTSDNPEQGEEKLQGQTKKKTEFKPQAPVEQKSSKSLSENEGKDEEKLEDKEQEKAEGKDEEKDESEKGPRPIFQGIGILKGEVTVTEEKSTIKLDGKEYRLYYIPGRRSKAYEALKHEIELTGNSTQRLIVYPKVLHLPKREQPHVVAFQLVGFIGRNSQPTPLNQELRDGEFKLSGLWQFIPVCRTPCISIFRNFEKERLAWIKQTEPARQVKFMKASHVPLLWKDSPVQPFRFNPKADKEEQGKPKFVQVQVKFIPSRDVFGFVEELAESRDQAPGFLKASKKLKAEAMAAAKEAKKQKQETSEQSKAPKEKKKNQSSQLEVVKEQKQQTSEQLEVVKEKEESQSSQSGIVKEKEESQLETSEVVKEKVVKKKTRSS